jgi:hypothetical protein
MIAVPRMEIPVVPDGRAAPDAGPMTFTERGVLD